MAAGEDQPQAIVGDFARVEVRLLDGRDRSGRGERLQLFREPRPAPDAVDGLVPGRLDDPCGGDSGTPEVRHWSRAAANASCTASSATSKSP